MSEVADPHAHEADGAASGGELACLDGEIALSADTVVPVTDPGLLRGDGVFEVIRVYDGRTFALTEHLDRLERSAANLRLAYEVPRSILEEEIPANGFVKLPMTARHALRAGGLPKHHADPFDRMLAAQAQLEELILVTHDRALARYGVEVLAT